jgi:hypothetical protein
MSEELERADNDSPWKEILEAYFPQAMNFFFPQTAALINWERPHEFLCCFPHLPLSRILFQSRLQSK